MLHHQARNPCWNEAVMHSLLHKSFLLPLSHCHTATAIMVGYKEYLAIPFTVDIFKVVGNTTIDVQFKVWEDWRTENELCRRWVRPNKRAVRHWKGTLKRLSRISIFIAPVYSYKKSDCKIQGALAKVLDKDKWVDICGGGPRDGTNYGGSGVNGSFSGDRNKIVADHGLDCELYVPLSYVESV